MTNDEKRDEQIYSLVALRRMTSVELVEQSTNNVHEIVRLRAAIELGKRDARNPRRVNR